MRSSWRFKTLATLGAAAAAAAVFAQWPFALASAAAPQDGRVTVSGDAVDAADVLARLRAAGVEFVVDADAVPKGKKLSLNIVAKPAKAALGAVAEALGLGVVERDGVFVLKREAPARPQGQALPRLFAGEFPEAWIEKLKVPEGTLKRFRLEEFLKEGDAPFVSPFPGSTRGLAFRLADPSDLKKLAESLTAAQRELHSKKGFLTPDDLTQDQRKLLGNPEGTFEIWFRDGDTDIKVKSKQ